MKIGVVPIVCLLYLLFVHRYMSVDVSYETENYCSLTAKLLKNITIGIRKSAQRLKFYRRHYELIEKISCQSEEISATRYF